MAKKTLISDIAIIALLLIYLAGIMAGESYSALCALAGAAIYLANIAFMGSAFRTPAWLFSIIGIGVLLFTRAPLSQWIYGLTCMQKSIIILIAIQPLSTAIEAGNYEKAVSDCLNRSIRSGAVLFAMIAVISHLLAGIMSLGSVVVILSTIMPAVRGKMRNEDAFAAESVSIGYSSLFLWAPGAVTVIISMQAFSLAWSEYFPPAFILGLIELAAGCLYGVFRFRKVRFDTVREELPDEHEGKRVLELVFVLSMIVVGIFVLEKLSFSHATGRMVVVTLLIALVWLAVITKRDFFRVVPDLWLKKALPKNADMYTFFLAMGLFSAAISYSGIEGRLLEFCSRYQTVIGAFVIPVLPLVIVFLALIGVHPFISAVIAGTILAALDMPVLPIQLGLALSIGCCMSYLISPFSGLVLTLTNNLNLTPAEICFKRNIGFVPLYYLIGTGFVYLLGALPLP